ncbi:MAG: hypothetical protein ACLP01_20285 [Solirubrobacteraceae bacterium]
MSNRVRDGVAGVDFAMGTWRRRRAGKVHAARRRRPPALQEEERRAHQEARERAEQARERFERTVALLASERPEREDWHAFPGAVPREELLKESGLSTQQVHRLMERQRRPPATRRSRP